jgi:hypothetical protein
LAFSCGALLTTTIFHIPSQLARPRPAPSLAVSMFRTRSAVCSRTGLFAKPLSSGLTKTLFSKGELADGGAGSWSGNPTILLLPRLARSCYTSSRGTKPFLRNSPHRNRRLINMASTKDYRLLCLENPLLGKFAR